MKDVEEARNWSGSFAVKAAREKRRVGCLNEERVGVSVYIPETATPIAITGEVATGNWSLCGLVCRNVKRLQVSRMWTVTIWRVPTYHLKYFILFFNQRSLYKGLILFFFYFLHKNKNLNRIYWDFFSPMIVLILDLLTSC